MDLTLWALKYSICRMVVKRRVLFKAFMKLKVVFANAGTYYIFKGRGLQSTVGLAYVVLSGNTWMNFSTIFTIGYRGYIGKYNVRLLGGGEWVVWVSIFGFSADILPSGRRFSCKAQNYCSKFLEECCPNLSILLASLVCVGFPWYFLQLLPGDWRYRGLVRDC